MRVSLDVSAVPDLVAGAGRYIVEVARRLPREGVSTTLVTRRGDATRWRSWCPDEAVAPIVPDERVMRLAYEAWRLGTSAPARSADVWHAPHYTMPRRGATPTVVTIHDLTFFTNPEWHERSKVAFFRRAIHYASTHAEVLVCVSDFTSRQLDEIVPDHVPVVVAPLGVDFERFNADSTRDAELFNAHGLDVGAAYVLFVGTVEPRKGIDVLLRAFTELSRIDSEVELWLAGQAGWGMSGFEATLAAHPASSRIRRLGFVSDEVLPALLRQARVVAYPSRGEGFGLPVLEAMACGAAVVTSADTVMAEVAGGRAVLVPAGDSEGLADALSTVSTWDRQTRLDRGARSRARAGAFTWDVSLSQHLVAYEIARSST